MASQHKEKDGEQASQQQSPPAPTTGYSSPYRHRFDRQRRREALDHLEKVHRIRTKSSQDSSALSPSWSSTSRDDDDQGKELQKTLSGSGALSSPKKGSLVEKQARLFGGVMSTTKKLNSQLDAVTATTAAAVVEEDRKSSASGGGTTVTTETASTTLTHHTAKHGYTALTDDSSDHTPKRTLSAEDVLHPPETSAALSPNHTSRRRPQHLETHKEEQSDVKYYRIMYPGVVALLSRPDRHAPKSGAYVSYGEIVASRFEREVVNEDDSSIDGSGGTPLRFQGKSSLSPKDSDVKPCASPESPQSLPRSLLSQTGSVSSLDTLKTNSTIGAVNAVASKSKAEGSVTKKVIRIDEVLTGGYALDANDLSSAASSSLTTPKRSNTHYVPMLGSSSLPLNDSRSLASSTDVSSAVVSAEIQEDPVRSHGYLYTEKRNATIVEPIASPPDVQRGRFLFSIVSSTPLPILTGPSLDAPTTKAMLLPATAHEICLKLRLPNTDVSFLRLSHRRGWITDRHVTTVGGTVKVGALPAVTEVSETAGTVDPDDSTVSALSVASSSIATPGSLSRRRHRPPRRKRDAGVANQPGTPSRSRVPTLLETPKKSLSPLPSGNKPATPSSNVSLISEDGSFDVSTQYNFAGTESRFEPSLFLMKVNAPRGLQILDAPHFQVSNLIHGKQENKASVQNSGDGLAKSLSRGSIFQTMAASHTTKGTGTRGSNPAVFDSVKKTRTLPRGVVFEASKRMETSGAFDMGAGLIKLADGSGWAIVPKPEELDDQFRRYGGGAAASLKAGEAARAYDEVGNAIILTDERTGQPSEDAYTVQWLRIVSRTGVEVSCPPPAPPLTKEEDTSPTASTGGSSSIVSGGASTHGILTTQDSDVASSVGSTFLDAMFRTPKKREQPETDLQSDPRAPRSTIRGIPRSEPQVVPTLLPCGMCVEVDRWTEDESSPSIRQDYVRLRGAQGWFPLRSQGKIAAVNIARPDVRLGSFWFRVMSQRGIKVRRGPSRKATSIKSDDGVYFRFECGEFLRASEIVTIFHDDKPSESFAKLFRNRHVKLNESCTEIRSLASMTSPAEWVQVHGDDQLYLEECGKQPRIQRHREGWRYNVIVEEGVHVRVGPSFGAESSGLALWAGESVLISERVNPAGESIAWLRLKDGEGWVHDLNIDGETVMIAHSLRHRVEGPMTAKAPFKADRRDQDDVAYNTIVARLFHSDGTPSRPQGLSCSYVKK